MSWPSSPDFSNVRYAPHLQTRLDVYRNAAGTDAGGNVGLVFFHGGGWAAGSKTDFTVAGANGYDFANYVLTSGLTSKRWNVVSADYRMSAYPAGTKMSFPSDVLDGIDDACAAIQHVKDNARLYGTNPAADARSYGINPNKIVAMGSSAGATLALIAAARRSRQFLNGAPGIRRRFDYRSSSVPALVVNYLGVIDVRYDRTAGVETWDYTKFPGLFLTSNTDGGVEWGAVPEDVKAAASPLAHYELDAMEARPGGVYSVYQNTTPTGKPYANVHAAEQAAIFDAALAARSIDRVTEVVAPGAWEDYTPTPSTSPSYALSARVVTFCEARLGV